MEARIRRKINWEFVVVGTLMTLLVLGALVGLHSYYVFAFTGPCAGKGGQNNWQTYNSTNDYGQTHVVCRNGEMVRR